MDNMTVVKSALPPWRSILFIPANNHQYVQEAHRRGADAIQLDLEDSIPTSGKVVAREQLSRSIDILAAHSLSLIVRVNQPIQDCVLDLAAAVRPEVSAICVPKVMSADHIRLIDQAIAELEHSQQLPLGRIRLIALIETVTALQQVEPIAKACPRLAALAIGTEDLSADGGFQPTPDNLFYPCQRIVLAASAAGLDSFGYPGSIADYSDPMALAESVDRGRAMGFTGAFCIHPQQVAIVNQVYEPTKHEYEEAKTIIQAYDQARKNQQGVVSVKGKMIDWPVVMRAKQILAAMDRPK